MALNVLRALCFLHERRRRHGDLKSLNIFINSQNSAKLGDIGTLEQLEAQPEVDAALGTRTFGYLSEYTATWAAPEVHYNSAVRIRVFM